MREYEILALLGINGIGDAAVSTIIKYLNELGINSLLDINFELLVNNSKLYRYKNKFIKSGINKDSFKLAINKAKVEIESLEARGIKLIPITSDYYPKSLKLISSPPVLLFCKGNLGLLAQNKNIAVIGSRKNTTLGKVIAAKTTQFFASSGYVIVSGLALGIDTIAHEECLECNVGTIAILVDVENIHPSKNRDLANNILAKGGLLISENKPGITIIPPLFAKRDRIQTGLSLAVFPIETAINGGTMHAVMAAKKENRLIYVPDYTKSGYQDKEIEQLSGIISLTDDPEVEPYTKFTYSNIINKLNQKEKELYSDNINQGALL